MSRPELPVGRSHGYEEGFQGRQAGGCDRDRGFDAGPDGRVGSRVGQVGGFVVAGHKSPEAKDGAHGGTKEQKG